MKNETKNCQNCKQNFTIESEDFNFYEKMQVPPPTFCSWCRFLRRLVWRNERVLHKRTCSMCEKSIISTYDEHVPFPVYCRDCWYGDAWDATTFGREYDFSRSFFEQFKELQNVVPRFALWQRNSINSDYSNNVAESKNVYLSISVTNGSENIFYSKSIDTCFNIVDSYNLKNSDSCYENTDGDKNYNSQYVMLSRNCIDSYFLVDCVNCSNCFMSYNLRNKQYVFKNVQYSKEEYLKEIEKYNFGSRTERYALLEEFKDLKGRAIYRFANIINGTGSSGNNLSNVKNCIYSFDGYDAENYKYTYRSFTSKDCMDYDYGQTSELMYEYLTGALNDYNVKFSYSAMGNVSDADYTDSCISAKNLFGCIGIRNKQNVILNKEYSKEEYEKIRGAIIQHMSDVPYVDPKGRIYQYGEFFPFDISPYGYNETPAHDFNPISRDTAKEYGYKWRDTDTKNHKITIATENIPDDIKNVGEGIIYEVLACAHAENCNHQCLVAFRITSGEFQFYKKHNIPLPDKCANCRYYERFNQVPLPKLYKRVCMNCNNVEFETPYAPDRPEIVYCERCYQQAVY